MEVFHTQQAGRQPSVRTVNSAGRAPVILPLHSEQILVNPRIHRRRAQGGSRSRTVLNRDRFRTGVRLQFQGSGAVAMWQSETSAGHPLNIIRMSARLPQASIQYEHASFQAKRGCRKLQLGSLTLRRGWSVPVPPPGTSSRSRTPGRRPGADRAAVQPLVRRRKPATSYRKRRQPIPGPASPGPRRRVFPYRVR